MSRKILLVDDAAFMRMMLRNTLRQNGYPEISESSNGEEALKAYQIERPDLVILDITMPVMDGLETLRRLRQLDPDANVVMCSAMGQESMVMEALKLGAKDFIVKPFKPERVMKTVSSILG